MTPHRFLGCLITIWLILIVSVLSGHASSAGDKEKDNEPPFEWDENYATPGTSLVLKEKERMQIMDNNTMVAYEVQFTGFSPQEDLSLWQKIGVTGYYEEPVTITEKGILQAKWGEELVPRDIYSISGFHLGEALDLALFSKTTNKRAHAKVFPFPIQAQGVGGCSAFAEMMDGTGHLFLITFQGFQSGEEVEVRSRYKKENKGMNRTASEDGEFSFPVVFRRGDRRKATATATGKNCTVSLEYKVGKDARKVQ